MVLSQKLSLYAVIVFSIAGCGSSGDTVVLYPVTGVVLLDGEPLPEGDIIFLPADGKGRSEGGSIKEGHFELKMIEGAKRVEVRASRDTGKLADSGIEPGKKVPIRKDYIPAKYNDKSELKAEVTAGGENMFSFELLSK